MPLVNATLAAKPDDELTARTIALLTDLTVEVLGKERGRTTVVVHTCPPVSGRAEVSLWRCAATSST